MPRYTNHTTFELVRNIKAFLRLEVGLTRGEVPDPERRHRAQAEKLQQAQGRVKMQAGEIKRLRETLDGERRDASNRQARDYLEGTPFGELVGDGGFEELPEAVRDATLHLKDEVEAVRLSEASAGAVRIAQGQERTKAPSGRGRGHEGRLDQHRPPHQRPGRRQNPPGRRVHKLRPPAGIACRRWKLLLHLLLALLRASGVRARNKADARLPPGHSVLGEFFVSRCRTSEGYLPGISREQVVGRVERNGRQTR